MSHDPTDHKAGPADGDFVGYLEKLEQHQIKKLHLPTHEHNTPSAEPTTPAPLPTQTIANPFSAEHRAQMRARFAAAQQKVGPLGLVQLVQALIGAGLLIASLAGEGNFVILVVGIALMWQPLARLQRLLQELNPNATLPHTSTQKKR